MPIPEPVHKPRTDWEFQQDVNVLGALTVNGEPVGGGAATLPIVDEGSSLDMNDGNWDITILGTHGSGINIADDGGIYLSDEADNAEFSFLPGARQLSLYDPDQGIGERQLMLVRPERSEFRAPGFATLLLNDQGGGWDASIVSSGENGILIFDESGSGVGIRSDQGTVRLRGIPAGGVNIADVFASGDPIGAVGLSVVDVASLTLNYEDSWNVRLAGTGENGTLIFDGAGVNIADDEFAETAGVHVGPSFAQVLVRDIAALTLNETPWDIRLAGSQTEENTGSIGIGAENGVYVYDRADFDDTNTYIEVRSGNVSIATDGPTFVVDGTNTAIQSVAGDSSLSLDGDTGGQLAVGDLKTFAFAGNGQEVIRIQGNGSTPKLAFFGGAGSTKPVITGSRGGNAALFSLLDALKDMGLITDSTS